MNSIDYAILKEAAQAGGASALSDITELEAAGGQQSLVAPAKYTTGSRPTYVFERRFIDGIPMNTVLLDSRTSEANRLEAALLQGIKAGQQTLSRMPKIIVTYDGDEFGTIEESDMQLPHRAFDAHVRLGFDAGDTTKSILTNERYIAARNASVAHAWGLFDISPITVVLGGWDSTRKKHQARFASCVTGEIIGVLSDQEAEPSKVVTHRSGARIDPIGASMSFSSKKEVEIRQRLELPPAKKGKEGKGSGLVIGAIPPGTGEDALDGISAQRIIRSRVLSFATLRSLEFDKGAEGDQAIRALLAAIAINAMVRADAELCLRANAHLAEKDVPKIILYKRFGEKIALKPTSIEEADELLDQAYEEAVSSAGLDWHGQTFNVTGEPAVVQGVDDTADNTASEG